MRGTFLLHATMASSLGGAAASAAMVPNTLLNRTRRHVAVPQAARADAGEKQQQAAAAAVMLNDSKTQAFVQVCTQQLGVSCSKMRPATFAGTGRGMAATQVCM